MKQCQNESESVNMQFFYFFFKNYKKCPLFKKAYTVKKDTECECAFTSPVLIASL